MNAITIENLSFYYESGIPILNHLSFTADKQDSIGIAGANGVGKSTLLKLLVGLYLNYDGTIRVNDFDVCQKNLPAIRQQIGYVFQDSDSQLFMTTAFEDIAFAPRNYGLSETEVISKVERALSLCKIEHLRDKQIFKMSGGEKKLVSIATILSMTPDIILMDEPSVALDPRNRRNLIQILNSFSHLKIIASHDLDLIWDTCNRTLLMSDGKIIADGPTKTILSDQKLLEQYGLELPLSLQKH